MFADISNINNNIDLYYILTGTLLVDTIVILLARDTSFFGKTINKWYDDFGLMAVLVDVGVILVGFIITRYIFYVINLDFSPELFIIVLLAVQIVHDYLLNVYVIIPYPKGNNKIIDIYKDYVDENGYRIILADAGMMIGSAVFAMYLKDKEMHETTSLLIVLLYIIPYFLTQKAKFP
jgi:hypothetical protein